MALERSVHGLIELLYWDIHEQAEEKNKRVVKIQGGLLSFSLAL
jgi:hypothetical protein